MTAKKATAGRSALRPTRRAADVQIGRAHIEAVRTAALLVACLDELDERSTRIRELEINIRRLRRLLVRCEAAIAWRKDGTNDSVLDAIACELPGYQPQRQGDDS